MSRNEKEEGVRLPPIEISDLVSRSENTSASPAYSYISDTDDFFIEHPSDYQQLPTQYDKDKDLPASQASASGTQIDDTDTRELMSSAEDHRLIFTNRLDEETIYTPSTARGISPLSVADDDDQSVANEAPDNQLTPSKSSAQSTQNTEPPDTQRPLSRKTSALVEKKEARRKKESVAISLMGADSTEEVMLLQQMKKQRKDTDDVYDTTSRDTVDTLTVVPKKKSHRLTKARASITRKSADMDSVDLTPPPPPPPPPRPQTRRFRKMAMKVMMNLLWREDLHLKHGTREEPFVVNTGRNQEKLMFDVNDFRVTRSHGGSSGGGLSQRCIEILSINPAYRTPEQLQYLKEVIPRLKCFDKYNLKTKHALSRVVCYDSFGDGRIIVQQGGEATATFYILSGSIRVTVTKKNPYTGAETTIVVGELGEGDVFGDVALTKNSKRNATCTCRGPCEFLRVEKDDFMHVLQVWHQHESAEVKKAFRWLPQFADWTRDQVNSTIHASHMAEFPPHKIIAGRLATKSEMVHFIVGGECRIIREVVLLQKQDAYHNTYYQLPQQNKMKSIVPHIAPPRPNASKASPSKKVSRFWSLGKLFRGHYFGAGEMVPNTHIITNLTVQCLQVPRSTFTRIGQGAQLARMREELEAALPTPRDISSRYLDAYRWARYKERLVKEVIDRRGYKCPTRITDVPLALRKENPSTGIRIVIPTDRNKKKWSIFTAKGAPL